jgi:hypothetical protein
MTPAVRVLATSVLTGLILLTGILPADAAPRERRVVIETIPAVPNFPIILDSKRVLTNESGRAEFKSRDSQNLRDRVKVEDQKIKLDGRKVRVEPTYKYLEFGQPTVAMSIFWQVHFSFVDLHGEPVDVDRIKSVQLKSSTGELLTVSAKEAVWLQGKRVVTLGSGPQEKEIQWSIDAVEYAASNVVNSAQQRFEPAETQAVPVELLFYRTTVRVKDAFFGFKAGDAVLVTSPDGHVDRFALGEDSTVNLPSLPRGNYSIMVDGPGPRMDRPVAISRDQILDLKFYSWLDIGLVVGFMAVFAIGTLCLGWWRRRAHRRLIQDGAEGEPHLDYESAATIQLPATPAPVVSASWALPPWDSVGTAVPPSIPDSHRRRSSHRHRAPESR